MRIMEKRSRIWVLAAFISIFGLYLLSEGIANTATYNSFELTRLVREDFDQLARTKALPNGLHDLYEIEKISTDKISSVWSQYLSLPFPIRPNGAYKLEVLVLQEESDHLTAILQYHLIHRESGNSVWELARQYKLYAD